MLFAFGVSQLCNNSGVSLHYQHSVASYRATDLVVFLHGGNWRDGTLKTSRCELRMRPTIRSLCLLNFSPRPQPVCTSLAQFWCENTNREPGSAQRFLLKADISGSEPEGLCQLRVKNLSRIQCQRSPMSKMWCSDESGTFIMSAKNINISFRLLLLLQRIQHNWTPTPSCSQNYTKSTLQIYLVTCK